MQGELYQLLEIDMLLRSAIILSPPKNILNTKFSNDEKFNY